METATATVDIELLKEHLKYSPPEPGKCADGFIGYVFASGEYLCRRCSGRLLARGLRVKDYGPSPTHAWTDDAKLSDSPCVACGSAPQ